MNTEAILQIKQELLNLESEIDRIEYYVSLLESGQKEVITLYYFERKSWTEIKEQLHVSQRALIKRRDDGIGELVKSFGFIKGVKNRKPG